MFWTKLLFALLALFIAWSLFRYVRANPQAFSASNLSKSFFSLGILALLLIVLVAIMVLFLRH